MGKPIHKSYFFKAIIVFSMITVITLLIGCTQPVQPNSDVSEASARSIWKSASPLAIVDWSREGTTFTLTVKNNSVDTLALFSGVKLLYVYSSSDTNPIFNFAPGASTTVKLSGLEDCKKGESFTYAKENILLSYKIKSDDKLTPETNIADLIGKCN